MLTVAKGGQRVYADGCQGLIRASLVKLLNEEFDRNAESWLAKRLLANIFAVSVDEECFITDVTLTENSIGLLDRSFYQIRAEGAEKDTAFIYIYDKDIKDGVLCIRWVKTHTPTDDTKGDGRPKTLFKES